MQNINITSNWVLAVCAVALLVSGITTFTNYQTSSHFALFLIWYSTMAAILIISGARNLESERVLERIKLASQRKLSRRRATVATLLRKKVRPRIDFCESLDEVCRRSYRLISDAHSQRIDEYRYITFYGAAHLSTPDAEIDDYGTVGGSGEVSPYQQYVGAVEAATGDRVRMRRYMRLFTDIEFKQRSFGVQREYINWLKGQHNMLSRNPNYVLADVVRAPKWGSNMARIITHAAIMEITGNGEAAVVITDNHLGETIRRAARDSVVGGLDVKNRPEYYGQAIGCKTPDDFKKYYSELERLLTLRATADEEGHR
jgi:hypothetical protein